ncbi:hypothetical protein BHE74_00017238 [Ensete ventricosum]|nr:hypothetical protein BHE74_00017238 [Ensete ventricosum]
MSTWHSAHVECRPVITSALYKDNQETRRADSDVWPQAARNDVDLEPRTMNLKERSHYVVNCDEDLTTVDFDSDKEEVWHRAGAVAWIKQKLSLDTGRKYGGAGLGGQDQEDSRIRGEGAGIEGTYGRKRRFGDYSRRSRGCSVSIALWKRTLATSK